jgi:hypothetical protein
MTTLRVTMRKCHARRSGQTGTPRRMDDGWARAGPSPFAATSPLPWPCRPSSLKELAVHPGGGSCALAQVGPCSWALPHARVGAGPSTLTCRYLGGPHRSLLPGGAALTDSTRADLLLCLPDPPGLLPLLFPFSSSPPFVKTQPAHPRLTAHLWSLFWLLSPTLLYTPSI